MTRRSLLAMSAVPGWGHGGIRRIDPPALAGSGMPFLTAGPGGSIYLSWIDSAGERQHALRFSRWTGSVWTAPETVAEGRNWFINWADFPSLVVRGDGSMLAHWLPRAEGGGTYGYGIRIAVRDRERPQWRPSYGVSLEEKVDYAGFLSFAEGGSAAAYLAPPEKAAAGDGEGAHDHRKTVRVVSFHEDGSAGADVQVDADACSCCQTAIARTRKGLLVAYRDRRPGEIRDISVVRFVEGAWTQPQPVHVDGWRINGCPTEGPAIATAGGVVAVAWLTRAGGTARVQLALSADDGGNFAKPLRLDNGRPLGRPTITPFDSSHFAAVWLERTEQGTEIWLRRISLDGQVRRALRMTAAPPGRAVGFPKIAIQGSQVILAWRDERVRASVLTKSRIEEMEQA